MATTKVRYAVNKQLAQKNADLQKRADERKDYKKYSVKYLKIADLIFSQTIIWMLRICLFPIWLFWKILKWFFIIYGTMSILSKRGRRRY